MAQLRIAQIDAEMMDDESGFVLSWTQEAVDPGHPQPDDVEKMEQFLAWVNNDPELKEYWKGDVPADGFEDEEQKSRHHLSILIKLGKQSMMSPAQQVRVWDLIQKKYNFEIYG